MSNSKKNISKQCTDETKVENSVRCSLKGLSHHCNEVDELMGTVSPWPIRWGITVIAMIMAILFVGSYYIRLPEKIQVPCTLSPQEEPCCVKAESHGTLVSLNKTSGQPVSAGDTICMIARFGKYQAITAPKSGFAEINISLTPGCEIQQGQELLYIFPRNPAVIALVSLTNSQVSKINKGMPVHISIGCISNQPDTICLGAIAEISSIPQADGSFVARIEVSSPTNNLNLVYKLHTVATITLGEKRLIQRLWKKV